MCVCVGGSPQHLVSKEVVNVAAVDAGQVAAVVAAEGARAIPRRLDAPVVEGLQQTHGDRCDTQCQVGPTNQPSIHPNKQTNRKAPDQRLRVDRNVR